MLMMFCLAFTVPAGVPGGIYSDLDAFGNIFRNPIFFDYNDVETHWVGRTDWSFSRQFSGTFFYILLTLMTV